MNKNNRGRLVSNGVLVSFQNVASLLPTEGETTEVSNVVKETEFGEVLRGTFSIKVTDDAKKVLYENKEEPFEYNKVNSLANALRYFEAKLDDSAITMLGTALTSKDEAVSKTIGEAVATVVKVINIKLRADAKSAAYQSLVNKYTPLEGEKRDTAMARLVANFIRLAGVSKETAVSQLVIAKALPEDYTVADFDATPLRRTKSDEDE